MEQAHLNGTPQPQARTSKSGVLALLGWGVLGLIILFAAWGAGRGEAKKFQVDVQIADVRGRNEKPALKRLAAELPKSVRKSRFRVRWNEVVGDTKTPCALHYDRNEGNLDLFRDTNADGELDWQDGFDDVNDAELIVASRDDDGLKSLATVGATRVPPPKVR